MYVYLCGILQNWSLYPHTLMYCHGTWTQWSLAWIESHMWPQQTWGQRSSRGQWPLVQVFGKKGQCIHILWCIFKSNITMIAKVCDRESRRDTWFENRLVELGNIFWKFWPKKSIKHDFLPKIHFFLAFFATFWLRFSKMLHKLKIWKTTKQNKKKFPEKCLYMIFKQF